ncbi:hypothetical protein ABIC63_000473 [Pseudacidovorax sp. 1753]
MLADLLAAATALVAVLLPSGVAWLIVRGCERHARRRRPR